MKNEKFDFDIKEFLDDQGLEFKEASSGRQLILASCPSCGKSNKFYISNETGQFICHYCASTNKEMSGGLINLVMLLGDLTFREAYKLVAGREVDIQTEDDAVSSLLKIEMGTFGFHKEQSSHAPIKFPDPIRMPKYMLPLDKDKFPQAWSYLTSRGILDEDILKLGAYVSAIDNVAQAAKIITKGFPEQITKKVVNLIYFIFKNKIEVIDSEIEKLVIKASLPKELIKNITDAILTLQNKGRVIFPVKLKNTVFGWVARDYTGQNGLKVRNSSGQFKFFCVWNYDQAASNKELVICEGIVSAIKCGAHRSIASLGKVVTPQQILTLKKTAAETVFICLDPDAQKDAMELKRNLLPLFKNVYNVSLPPVKLVGCPSCGKKHEMDMSLKQNSLSCQCGAMTAGLEFAKLIKKAAYKDAGDYSKEEMDAFIESSRSDSDEGFMFGNSIFDE